MYGKAKELNLKIHAAGNVDDHVHIIISIPPKLAVADCVKHIKGASTYAINHIIDSGGQFKWQESYGALSIGEHLLDTVMAYVAHQQEHPDRQATISVYERLNEI